MSAVLTHDDECHAFESAIRALHAEIANVGALSFTSAFAF